MIQPCASRQCLQEHFLNLCGLCICILSQFKSMEKAQGLNEIVQKLNLQHRGSSGESQDSTACEVVPSLTSTGRAMLEEGSQAVELGHGEKRTLLGCHSAESQNRTSLLHDLLCKENDNFFSFFFFSPSERHASFC